MEEVVILGGEEQKIIFKFAFFGFLREGGPFDKRQFHLSCEHRYRSSKSVKGRGRQKVAN